MWPDSLPAFGRFNVIYGWNGAGKGTVAALLHHIEARTDVEEGIIQFLFDKNNRVDGANLSTAAALPQVRVFDRAFVEATILPTGGGIAPIYFLGKESVALQKEIGELRSKLENAQQEGVVASERARQAQTALDRFCIQKAGDIKAKLTSSTLRSTTTTTSLIFGRLPQVSPLRRIRKPSFHLKRSSA